MHGSQFGLFDFQLFRESAAHLGYLKRMGETIMKDVAEFARDNLRGCREALQSGRIENNVPVALKVIPVIPLPTLLRKEPLNASWGVWWHLSFLDTLRGRCGFQSQIGHQNHVATFEQIGKRVLNIRVRIFGPKFAEEPGGFQGRLLNAVKNCRSARCNARSGSHFHSPDLEVKS
jgi:hypothetical protein